MTLSRGLARLVMFSPRLYLATFSLQIMRFVLLIVPALIARELLNTLQRHVAGASIWSTGLLLLTATLVGAAVVRVGLVMAAIFVEYTTSHHTSGLLRRNAIVALLEGAGAQTSTFAVGDLVGRVLIDAGLIGEFLRMTSFVFGGCVTAAAAIWIMLSINLKIGALAVAPTIFAAVVVLVASRRMAEIGRLRREADGRVHAFVVDAFAAARGIQLAAAENHVARRFAELNDARRMAAQKEIVFRDVMVTGVFENIKTLTIALILFVSVREMLVGSFTAGDFVLFVSMILPVGDFAVQLGRHFGFVPQVRVSWRRLREIVGGEPDLTKHEPIYLSGAEPPIPALAQVSGDALQSMAVRQLRYRHPSSGRDVEVGDFTVRAGGLTVVTGPVGSGKTTLLRAVLGLLPSTGVVEWNGRAVDDRQKFLIPPRVGYVAQVPMLFANTLRENITLGRPFTDEQLDAAVRLAMFSQDVCQLDKGLDTLVGPRGIRLSGGQAQRCAAARSFIFDPELVVMDDLSSALDVKTEAALWDGLLATPRTYLAVTHREATIRRASHVIVLDEGRIAAQGPPGEVPVLWRRAEPG